MSEPTTTHQVDDLSCQHFAAGAFAERYLLGELSESERDDYECHFFDCEHCFHELTTVGALRTELNAAGLAKVDGLPPSERRWWPAWLAAALIVLGIGLWTMWPVREPGPASAISAIEPTPSPPAPVATSPAPPAPIEPPVSLSTLARFEPPPYDAPVLRGPEDEAKKLFRTAMEHYLRGDHKQAIDGLRLATGHDPRASDAGFFLGVSLLLTKQSQAGITELRRTIALGDSPYLEEAHFYLAKGLLQVGDVNAAKRQLRAMIALGGDRQREAKQLLSQVERVRQER
jgi:hypothetical protein